MSFGLTLSAYDSRLIKQAVNFFNVVLSLDDKDIPVEVRLVNNIGKGKTAGTCKPIFDEPFAEKNKLIKVEIEIKQSATTIGMIEALAHEMVHAKQFIDGDSSFEWGKQYFFFKLLHLPKLIRLWNGKDVSHLKYYEQPSEQEAHLLQKSLTLQFLNHVEQDINPIFMAKLIHLTTESIRDCNHKEKL